MSIPIVPKTITEIKKDDAYQSYCCAGFGWLITAISEVNVYGQCLNPDCGVRPPNNPDFKTAVDVLDFEAWLEALVELSQDDEPNRKPDIAKQLEQAGYKPLFDLDEVQ